MWEYYDGRSVLVTGGSGFLGTAIVHRLLSRSSVCHVYLICRGGEKKLRSKWKEWLPFGMVEKLCDSAHLSVFDGDILLPDLGLEPTELMTLRHAVQIVIHAASSISLAKPLQILSKSIIAASEAIAEISLTFKDLDRFIYVSTAYANTHLYTRSEKPGIDLNVEERFYDLEKQGNTMEEWESVRRYGTSEAYEAEDFPWDYAYAKHLTERLLLHRFSQHASEDKLLIVRPSIIGPAQCFPFPGYSMPTSTPSTMLAAAIALTPSWRCVIATRMALPEAEVTADEVPVDVVVDRLLSHLAAGHRGCVHAVSGTRARMSSQEWWESAMKLRRIPWKVRPLWLDLDWKDQKQHSFSRLWVILGTSFSFSEGRTLALSRDLDHGKPSDLQLFTRIHMSDHLMHRERHVKYVMEKISQKSTRAWFINNVFYRNFGHSK
ncbi:hypothetical protein N7520_008469 [Penicillium odoratum]|uniref:uncharacterized protein n=1 Tax=Penicillium odoratum TaxID=1167516 RepID=UPI002546A282|nr:uncharacterized protein N7520_008469 [Penicillium odoratum]KAJ5761313.1 hypothetical protein N7520_008469 [Penicillium odoratum]